MKEYGTETIYEAYDRTERIIWGREEPKEKDPAKKESIILREKRIYELSQIDGMPEEMPYQISFRLLTTLLQTYSGDVDAVIKALGDVKPEQEECLRRRAACAWYWITESAPDCAADMCFKIRDDGSKAEDISGDMLTAVQRVRDEVVSKLETYALDKECQQAMYDIATSLGLEAKALFTALYHALINKDQGPRLANFMRIIGKERLTKILSVY